MNNIIIVIGCSDLKSLYKRLDLAINEFKSSTYEYFSEICNSYIILKYLIFTGSISNKNSFIKAEIMEEYAMCCGIDKKFIIKEPNAKTVYDSFINVKNILESQDLSFKFYNKNITICTSSFQLKRCVLLSNFLLKDYNISYLKTDEEITLEKDNLENLCIIEILNILYLDY